MHKKHKDKINEWIKALGPKVVREILMNSGMSGSLAHQLVLQKYNHKLNLMNTWRMEKLCAGEFIKTKKEQKHERGDNNQV